MAYFFAAALFVVLFVALPAAVLIGRASRPKQKVQPAVVATAPVAVAAPVATPAVATVTTTSSSTTASTKFWKTTWFWGILGIIILLVVVTVLLRHLGMLPPIVNNWLTEANNWVAGWKISDVVYIVLALLVTAAVMYVIRKWVAVILLIAALAITLIAFSQSGIWQEMARSIEDFDACKRNPFSAACVRIEENKPNARLDGRWEEIIPGKTYAVKDNEWLIFTRPPKKCVSISPPEGLEVKFPGNEVWIRSRSGTRFIVPCILHIGEADADGDICT